nr:MAG TPA: hypothetical protein [Caudoviricetes sp.]
MRKCLVAFHYGDISLGLVSSITDGDREVNKFFVILAFIFFGCYLYFRYKRTYIAGIHNRIIPAHWLCICQGWSKS